MTKIFRDSKTTQTTFHLQLLIDTVPDKPLTSVEADRLIYDIRNLIEKRHPTAGMGVYKTQHRMVNCSLENCTEMPSITRQLDQFYHEQEGTEH